MGLSPIREITMMYRIEKWGALWKVYPPIEKTGPAVKFKTEAEAQAYVASMTGQTPASLKDPKKSHKTFVAEEAGDE